MKLSQKQQEFTRCLGKLLLWCQINGIAVVLKEVFRPPEMAALYAERGTGIKNSLHAFGLAADLVVFKEGMPSWNLSDYQEIGRYWKSLHPLARWGGDFKGGIGRDPGHVSLEHNGVK